MKSPTSIVNTLLESDYADYDPNLDPFRDPKNITHDDLGYAYISKKDVEVDPWDLSAWPSNWCQLVRSLGLVGPPTRSFSPLSGAEQRAVGNIHKIYVESIPRHMPGSAFIDWHTLTDSALARLKPSLAKKGDPDNYWPVRVAYVNTISQSELNQLHTNELIRLHRKRSS